MEQTSANVPTGHNSTRSVASTNVERNKVSDTLQAPTRALIPT